MALPMDRPVPKLFTALKLGTLDLTHRVVMAPLTRCRSNETAIPSPLMALYYAQRTTPGALLISEATQISQEGQGMPNTPGIYTRAQMEAWKGITQAVHDKGGFIFAQLWHMGRQSHSSYQPGGAMPVAPSAVPIKSSSRIVLIDGSMVPYEVPRALDTDEIARVVDDYIDAAKLAMEAGFDGVELHGANGYLVDQFLHDSTNIRTDQYGGSIPNRVRFLVEVLQGLIEVWLSPPVYVEDTDREALFTYAISEVSKLNIVYLHLLNPNAFQRIGLMNGEGTEHLTPGFFRPHFNGVLIENGRIDRADGMSLVERGECDAIAYGIPFIANPDLVHRLMHDLPMAKCDTATWFTQGVEGLSDYPNYEVPCVVVEGMEDVAVSA